MNTEFSLLFLAVTVTLQNSGKEGGAQASARVLENKWGTAWTVIC
jgi:hypothetical protein